MKNCIATSLQHNHDISFKIIFVCISFLFIGTVYFIPDWCADRFHTPILLWIGCLLGILGIIISILEYQGMIFHIPVSLIALYLCWGISWVLTSSLNYNSVSLFFTDNMVLLLLYYYFANHSYYSPFYFLLISLAGSVCLIAFLQLFGIFSSYSSTFVITATFDNPAGISAVLAALLPFTFYFFSSRSKLSRNMSIIICVMVVISIILSNARAAILAMIAIFLGYFLKRKLLFVCCVGLLLVLLYLMKPDSANGRLLIWRCCAQTIIDNPLLGAGEFTAWYMLDQACFLTKHSNELWAILLSDNIRHPFNEYLEVVAERGIIGFISSFFILILHPLISDNRRIVKVKVHRWIVFFLSTILLINTFYQGFYDIKWTDLLKSENPCDVKNMCGYEELYQNSFLGQQSAFLYNYGVVLHQAGEYRKSNDILLKCSKKMNDYDVQLLQGYNYLEMENMHCAEGYFKTASNIIPCRLLPLYELFRIYVATGRDDLALETAQNIINMPVKIVSAKTNFIKKRVSNYLKQAKKGGVL